jgi:hypothetical protein
VCAAAERSRAHRATLTGAKALIDHVQQQQRTSPAGHAAENTGKLSIVRIGALPAVALVACVACSGEESAAGSSDASTSPAQRDSSVADATSDAARDDGALDSSVALDARDGDAGVLAVADASACVDAEPFVPEGGPFACGPYLTCSADEYCFDNEQGTDASAWCGDASAYEAGVCPPWPGEWSCVPLFSSCGACSRTVTCACVPPSNDGGCGCTCIDDGVGHITYRCCNP